MSGGEEPDQTKANGGSRVLKRVSLPPAGGKSTCLVSRPRERLSVSSIRVTLGNKASKECARRGRGRGGEPRSIFKLPAETTT